jgi:antitoxin ParD1/3/4
MVAAMKMKMRSISLPGEMDAFVQSRVRTGMYANASDVIRAGLRALVREEMADRYKQFQEIMAKLPDGPPITPEIEQDIVRRVKVLRSQEKGKARK